MFMRLLRQLQRFDWPLLASALALFLFGVAAIYSVELSQESANFATVRKQLFVFLLGVGVLFVSANVNYLFFRSWGRLIYLFGLALMVLVLIFGRDLNGTTGWFVIFGVSFQPVEFMKLALAVMLARYFSEHARRRFGWREILGSGFLVALPAGLTILQPDLGSASLLVGMWLVVMFFAGIRFVHVAVLSLGATIAGLFAWFFVFADYQKQRVLVFLNPELDPLATGYNVTQAKIAIGSGQLFGRGLGFGSQSQLQFLPESQTDFIFAVIAEELGFIGVTLLLVAIGFFLWRLLRTAQLSAGHFGTFLAIAFFGIFSVQMVINIGVNLALLPATGVSLPFVSAGGSSLLLSFVFLGIIQNMAIQRRPGAQQQQNDHFALTT